MPQHTKMYFITPQSKMASWISLLCLPSLDCDTKQTHNKPSSTTQVRNYSQGQHSLLSKTVSLSYLYKSRTQWSHFGGVEIFLRERNMETFYSLTPSPQDCCCTHMIFVVGPVLWILLYPWGSLRSSVTWGHTAKSLAELGVCTLKFLLLGCARHPPQLSSGALLHQSIWWCWQRPSGGRRLSGIWIFSHVEDSTVKKCFLIPPSVSCFWSNGRSVRKHPRERVSFPYPLHSFHMNRKLFFSSFIVL